MACARPSQTATTPRARVRKNAATGPVPVRTARGAGRAAGRREEARLFGVERPRLLEDFAAGFFAVDVFAVVFRALRVVEPVPDLGFRAVPEDPDLLDEDVLVLRDPGGEDVRVAMPPT